MKYTNWCALSNVELAQRDIAEVNLAAALGLPFAEALNISALCCKLDDWADQIDSATRQAVLRRATRGMDADLTDAQFRVGVMATVLYRHLGVRYYLPFIQEEYDAADSRNLFIHGVLTGHGGTCVTMPVLYAALGRRLQYPLKLVHAKEHTFCRWDDAGGEQFNIETTSPGLNLRPDEYYLRWPHPISTDELEHGWYLRNLSPRQELAMFLAQRGQCWLEHLQTARAAQAFHYVHMLDGHPSSEVCRAVATVMHRMLSVGVLVSESTANPHLTPSRAMEAWEARFYPLAARELNRILSNHKKRQIQTEHSIPQQ